jgi:thiol-disulfide isomerase/thioredoxin
VANVVGAQPLFSSQSPMQKYGTHISLAILLGLVVLLLYQGAARRAEEQAMVGQAAESFRLPLLGTRDIVGPQDYLGRVVLLDFWAVYCAPCREAMPDLQRLHERYAGQDFALLSVNVDPSEPGLDRPAMVREFLRRNGLTFPVLLDYGPASAAYGVTSIPYLVLIDRSGQVRFVHRRPTGYGTLSSEIEALLGEPG